MDRAQLPTLAARAISHFMNVSARQEKDHFTVLRHSTRKNQTPPTSRPCGDLNA